MSFQSLVAELKAFEVSVSSDLPADLDARYDLLVDAIFGMNEAKSHALSFPHILQDLASKEILELLSIVFLRWHLLAPSLCSRRLFLAGHQQQQASNREFRYSFRLGR